MENYKHLPFSFMRHKPSPAQSSSSSEAMLQLQCKPMCTTTTILGSVNQNFVGCHGIARLTINADAQAAAAVKVGVQGADIFASKFGFHKKCTPLFPQDIAVQGEAVLWRETK